MPSIEQTQRESAGKGPHPELNQAKIVELAEAKLHLSPYSALRNVICTCRDGTLVLYGRLPSYHLKQIAQTAVASLPGVEQVENRIDVADTHR